LAKYNAEKKFIAGTNGELEILRRERDEAVAAREAALDMLATFTHELRTPLTGILGMANLLLGTRLGEDQEHYARTIWETGSHLRRLVDDVVELSMLESDGFRLETAPACPAEIVRGVFDIVAPEARKKRLALSWRIDSDLEGEFALDAARLRQVLLNLLANAIRYTDRGSVKVIASVEPDAGHGSCAVFTVADTGIGMSEEVRAGLFSRFMRAGPPDRRGAGLGLAISRHIVELMEGRIDVESVQGRGSRFSVTVPLLPPGEAASVGCQGGRSVVVRPENGSRLDLLLVEDDELNQMYFETLLRAGGHRVTTASNGREALAAAGDKIFDAILMDIQMPVMDGIAATGAIRGLPGEKGRVPVIALTGGVDRQGGRSHKDAGFSGFLSKPIDIGELSRALSEATGQRVVLPDYAVSRLDVPPPLPGASEAVEALLDDLDKFDSSAK